MTQNELHLLVKEGEGLTVEFKEKFTPKIDRDIVAMANAVSFEERIHKDVSWEDISKEKIKTFFKEAGIVVNKISPQDVLTSLGLAMKGGIKNAGVLFFAKDPRRHIFHCETILVSYKGISGVNILDRKDVQDDLWTQYQEAMIFFLLNLNGQKRTP